MLFSSWRGSQSAIQYVAFGLTVRTSRTVSPNITYCQSERHVLDASDGGHFTISDCS